MVPWVTTMKAGPGCECQPVEPPGAIVVVRTTVSVGALEKILKLGELSWNGATLIRPSVVLVTPEGGVAHATPASVNGARNRKPAMMITMRFMCVQSLLQSFPERGWALTVSGSASSIPGPVAALGLGDAGKAEGAGRGCAATGW